MFNELQTWWQNSGPEMQATLQDIGLVAAALLGGHFLGAMTARTLRSWNFDATLRLPGSSPRGSEQERGVTPTRVAGLLVRVTIWASAFWWLAHKHGRVELAHTVGATISRTWAVAAILVAALSLGSLLAQRLIDCLSGPSNRGSELHPSRNGAGDGHRTAAGAVGAAAYALVILLVLLIAADLLDWPLTRSSALALWQFAQHLFIAGAALFIGNLGARWAREQVSGPPSASPSERAGQYTALGILAATTVLAVAVLLSGAGVLMGLAALVLLGFLLWLVRGYLPDVLAGLQLRTHQVREVQFDRVTWKVAEIGFLTTQLSRAGEFGRLSNHRVLEARFHEAPAETATR